jgi:hypothetical protein
MSRSAKTIAPPATSGCGAASTCDDIESEFLGIWLGLARLREKIRRLAAAGDLATAPAPQRPV